MLRRGQPLKIIVDTDIGDDVDDILALAFALRRPEFEVLGVTTVFGNVDGRCRMVSRLLRGLGLTHIPVTVGRALPLKADCTNLERLRNTPYQGAFAADEPSQAWPDAVSFLLDVVRRHKGDVGIITLGPITNIGAALQAEPEFGRHVQFIACMGGSAIRTHHEYNVNSDPEAAHLVFTSGARLFLGTWETTRQFTLLPPDVARIASTHTSLAQMLLKNIELWRPVQGNKPGPVMYDAAPIIWAIRPDLYPTIKSEVHVELEGSGRGCLNIMQENPNVELSVAVALEEVKEFYLQTVLA